MARDFAQASAWAKANGVAAQQVLLGEFGVSRTTGPYVGAAEADRLLWLATVRTAAERAGFGWCLWSYSGPVGMTLANGFPARSLDRRHPARLGSQGVSARS